jgi:hypothetical protein
MEGKRKVVLAKRWSTNRSYSFFSATRFGTITFQQTGETLYSMSPEETMQGAPTTEEWVWSDGVATYYSRRAALRVKLRKKWWQKRLCRVKLRF